MVFRGKGQDLFLCRSNPLCIMHRQSAYRMACKKMVPIRIETRQSVSSQQSTNEMPQSNAISKFKLSIENPITLHPSLHCGYLPTHANSLPRKAIDRVRVNTNYYRFTPYSRRHFL